jgi:hypothetical protein
LISFLVILAINDVVWLLAAHDRLTVQDVGYDVHIKSLSNRPLCVVRVATPLAFGEYATLAMLFAPKMLLRTSAFCASCRKSAAKSLNIA